MSRQRASKQDTLVIEGSQLCTHCKRVKPLDQFGIIRTRGRSVRPRYWCRACDSICVGLREETPERKAWRKVYLARPDVQARNREYERRRRGEPERAAMTAACKLRYTRSPRGKLVQCRSRAAKRLEGAVGEKRAQVLATIKACDRQLERIST